MMEIALLCHDHGMNMRMERVIEWLHEERG